MGSSPGVLANLVGKERAHPEYLTFQDQLGSARIPVNADPNAWDLISDAVGVRGGFIDGSYLIPHELEVAGGSFDAKYWERVATARYDDFAKQIAEGPWQSIVGLKDTIVRKSSSKRLEAFWQDVDGDGTSVIDFLEYPAGQARRYGTGWIFVDRERVLENLEQDEASAPWAYCIPTRNIVWWEHDRAGVLESIVYRKPWDGRGPEDLPPLMVWTRKTWSIWIGTDSSSEPYQQDAIGTNQLGEIPAVPLYDGKPAPGKAFGRHNMLATALTARDVYNRDSEIREIERRAACPVLGVLVENFEDAEGLKIATDRVLASTGKSLPGWIEPNLGSIDKLEAKNKAVKEAAFVSAGMSGLMGHGGAVETSSGFHSEVELDKSERTVSLFGSACETADQRMARLVLRMVGEPDADFEVSYPRKFGITDLGTTIDRTKKRLELNGGPDHDLDVWRDYFGAVYPRREAKLIEAAATRAVAEHQAAKEEAKKAFEQTPAPMTARDRVKGFRAGKGAAA